MFLKKLTLNLGYKTVEQLKNTMSMNELYEWYEYYNLEVFGFDRLEIQLATLTQAVASFGGSKLEHNDFMITNKKKKNKSNLEDTLLSVFGEK